MDLQRVLDQRTKVEEFTRKHRIGLLTLLFTDLVGSTKLKQELGDHQAIALIQRHRALLRQILGGFAESEEIETAGDSFFIVFAKPSDAVQFSLLVQSRMRELNRANALRLLLRIGLHIGEVTIEERTEGKPKDLYGLQIDICARVMSLAEGDQILLTRSAFDNARQVLKGQGIEAVGALAWMNHGPYLLKGVEEPMEICEVGEADAAILKPPPDSDKVHRFVSPDAEPVLGWRPALDQKVPGTQWTLEEKLGEGGFGEVWLGRHGTTKERRVFKFCFRADRVRALKREVTLFRLLKERVGEHPNVVRLLDVFFEEPPYYLEMEFVAGRDLKTWSEERGGVGAIPLEMRLEIVAQVADALQAAHDAGIIHRDVKPSNILIHSHPSTLNSQPTAKLTDFGIGQVVSEETLAGLTKLGFTQTMMSSGSTVQSGTQMYMAPELIAGKPASTRSDIYSLGVVLYQLLVGELTRPLTVDWAKEVNDEFLRSDLEHCFAGNPEERFENVRQLAENLRTLKNRHAAKAEQRTRYRRRVRRAIAVTAAALVAVPSLTFGFLKWQEARRVENAKRTLGAAYSKMTSYQDRVTIKMSMEQGGVQTTVDVSDSLIVKKPNKLFRTLKLTAAGKEIEIRLISDGMKLWTYFPTDKQYTVRDAPKSLAAISVDKGLSALYGPSAADAASVYSILLNENPQQYISKQVRNIELSGKEEVDGTPAYIFTWKQETPLSLGTNDSVVTPVAVKAWVSRDTGIILQVAKDLTQFLAEATKRMTNAPRKAVLTRMVVTEKHTGIRINEAIPDEAFVFNAPPDAKPVEKLQFIASIESLLRTLGPSGPAPNQPQLNSAAQSRLQPFFAMKERQARGLTDQLSLTVALDVWEYFGAAAKGDWQTVANLYASLQKRSSQYEGSRNDPSVSNPVWQTIIETYSAYEAFSGANADYALKFGRDIIDSIPLKSIYLGGTDWGRCLVTALCRSHAEADPFFTLTQNALADSSYLTYLRKVYGGKIYVPTDDDSSKAFKDYIDDAVRRLRHDAQSPNEPKQVKPGEALNLTREGRVQVNGQVAVMSINAILTKIIFDKNPGQEFYIEESFPLDWMFPHLTPFGIIMKLNRKPVGAITEEIMDKDHEYWSKYSEHLIGNWITYDTSAKEICDFAEKTYLRYDFSGFTGDPRFARDTLAQKAFSKLRSGSGNLYWWRIGSDCPPELRPKTKAQQDRLLKEADFAFRQAYALCPSSPEALHKYLTLLLASGRIEDARLITETSLKFDPENPLFRNYAEQVKHMGASQSK